MEKDTELLDIIDMATLGNPDSYVAALDVVLRFQKKYRGLVGMHVSFDPFAEQDEDKHAEMEKRAKALLMFMRASAEGMTEDITDKII